MKETFDQLKHLLAGRWAGEGFARFPSIDPTAYFEETEFSPDAFKDVIFFVQKAWYQNDTEKNGQTVFWDTGFIILLENKIVLHSAQLSGRIEQYELSSSTGQSFTFSSRAILVDEKAYRSQRVFTVKNHQLSYELNMATHKVDVFQNHLKASLKMVEALYV